jgi:hypothetical protein
MAQILFTVDFHEFVRGKLQYDKEITIQYDPLRLAGGRADHVHGSPDYEFTAQIRFEPQGTEQSLPLRSKVGILEKSVVHRDGLGSMLTGSFVVPANTEQIVIWVCMKEPGGQVFYDSDYGENYHFRLASEDIQITKAEVLHVRERGSANFNLTANSVAAIDNAIVRYRITNGKNPFAEYAAPLHATMMNDRKVWNSGNVEVPFGAVVSYEVIYYISAKKFKVDNNGKYYIATPVNDAA